MATRWRMGQALALLVLSLYVNLAAAGAATDPVPVPAAGKEEELQELEEVEVTGTRLWKMRQQLVELEDQFYALYNELNGNDDFDVTCRMEAPLGTRLKKRNCKVAFYEEAEAEFAQAFLRGEYAPDPQIIAAARHKEYRAAAVKAIESDKRLMKLMEKRVELEKRYKDERKRRFKGRWILFE